MATLSFPTTDQVDSRFSKSLAFDYLGTFGTYKSTTLVSVSSTLGSYYSKYKYYLLVPGYVNDYDGKLYVSKSSAYSSTSFYMGPCLAFMTNSSTLAYLNGSKLTTNYFTYYSYAYVYGLNDLNESYTGV